MACIDREFCDKCDKVTEHMSYVGDVDCPPISYHCTECARREIQEKIVEQKEDEYQKIKDWSKMTLEEKVENLNMRLKQQEVGNMTF